MANMFDYRRKEADDYQRSWNNSVSRKDPRLARRDDPRTSLDKAASPTNKISPISSEHNANSPRMYSQQAYGYGEYNNAAYNQTNVGYQQQQGYAPAPPNQQQQQQGYGTNYQYQGYSQSQQQQSSSGYSSGQPVPPGDDYSGGWTTTYPNMSQPPPPVPRPSQATTSTSSSATKDESKKEAVQQEMKQQRATLVKQRDEYMRKASVLKRELEKLRAQKHELLSEKSPPRDQQRILRENAKLQLEIQNKLKSINNVVDMLSGIIGDGLDSQPSGERSSDEDHSSSKQDHSTVGQYNYIHFDPELHWCRICDTFPHTAKDYLVHLQSAEHRQVAQDNQLVDTPWHKLPADPELPSVKNAPTKRVPIKGLQFFISAPAWYCKLCDSWIGDLHCASIHLKSKIHAQNYSNFVEQNPQWESNWLKDREKAQARCLGSETPNSNDKRHRKKEDKLRSDKEDKKRKKKRRKKRNESSTSSNSSSSSSSSDSSSDDADDDEREEDDDDRSKSIRVAMRNKMRMQAQMILKEELGGKLEALGRLVEERERSTAHLPPPPPPPVVEQQMRADDDEEGPEEEGEMEDQIVNQWMTDGLKGRVKIKQQEVEERQRVAAAAELQRRRERERELREREERERQKNRKTPEQYRKKNEPTPKRERERDRERDRGERDRERHRHHGDKKRKLPFIGRMPLFKKKEGGPDDKEKEIKREEYARPSKFEPGNTARAFIPAPGVVHIMQLATPPDLSHYAPKPAENPAPPPPPQIIPEPPVISERCEEEREEEEDDLEEQQMQMEEASVPAPMELEPEEPPPQEHKPRALPRDFQEALNIIYPGEQRADPALMQHYYEYNMNYGMMYAYEGAEQEAPPSNPTPPEDDKEDLALLGIDAADMAAQTI